MIPTPIPIAVLAIQASHAELLVSGLRADVQARRIDTSTAIRQVRRDQAVGLLLAAEQLMQSARIALQAIAEDRPEAECFLRVREIASRSLTPKQLQEAGDPRA